MTDIKAAQGLEVVAWLDGTSVPYSAKLLKIVGVDVQGCEPLCRLSDATAVIDQLRVRAAELEADLKLTSEMLVEVSRKGMALREELATLKPAPVVMPDRHKLEPYYQTVNTGSKNWLAGWNACLDEVERLNRRKDNEQ